MRKACEVKNVDGTCSDQSAAISRVVIHAASGGEWIDPENFRQSILKALSTSDAAKTNVLDQTTVENKVDLGIDLAGLDHLDASGLQILLAAEAELCARQRRLVLMNASQALRNWFEFAGAFQLLEANSIQSPEKDNPHAQSADCR